MMTGMGRYGEGRLLADFHPADTAGGIMQTEYVSVPQYATVEQAIGLIRRARAAVADVFEEEASKDIYAIAGVNEGESVNLVHDSVLKRVRERFEAGPRGGRRPPGHRLRRPSGHHPLPRGGHGVPGVAAAETRRVHESRMIPCTKMSVSICFDTCGPTMDTNDPRLRTVKAHAMRTEGRNFK